MSHMVEVGHLERDLGASAFYAIEDELDWEHLPYVHASTFSEAKLIQADRNGWEADVVLTNGDAMLMRVTVDEDRMGYVNATFADGVENGRAVARLTTTGPDTCRISLRFFVPDRRHLDRKSVGGFYQELFGRLLDEDEPKMILRAKAVKDGPSARKLRRMAELADGTKCEVPVVCPHRGLPLTCEPDSNGTMTCPWHGYQFDARTGKCLSGQIRGWKNSVTSPAEKT